MKSNVREHVYEFDFSHVNAKAPLYKLVTYAKENEKTKKMYNADAEIMQEFEFGYDRNS